MLHGRDEERARLDSLLEGVRASRGGALVVRGVAGAGKSALLADAADRAKDSVRVLTARGVESESELAFAALHQLLLPVLDRVDRLPAPQAAALRAAFGLETGDAHQDRFLVSLATLALLSEAADEQPVLAIVDDAHWLDEASARVLLFVARRLDGEPVGMVFGAREEDRRHFDAPDLPDLALAGLDHAAARALLSEQAGVPVTQDVAERLLAGTGGNPLALAELPAALTWEQLTGLAPLPAALPLTEGVERAFLDRVRRLPDATRTLLLVAAAEDTGRLATITTAADALGATPDDLDPAERDGLVTVKDGALEFRHPLVRSALYGGATTGERRAAHAALADVADPERRVWHRAAATVEPDDAVAADLDDAADNAANRGGYEAACAALERAAALTKDDDARARRLAGAANHAWLAGQSGRAVGLIEAARPLSTDTLVRADVDRLRGVLELSARSIDAARRILVDAARAVAGIDPARAIGMIGLAAEAASLAADAPAAVELGEFAASLDPGEGAREQVTADVVAGTGLYFGGDRSAGIVRLRRAIVRAEASGEPDVLASAGRVAFFVGDDDLIYRLNADIVARARAAGALGQVVPSITRLVMAEVLTGRWASATSHAAELERLDADLAPRGPSAASAFGQIGSWAAGGHAAPSYVALVAACRGDDVTFDRALARAASIPNPSTVGAAPDNMAWARGLHDLAAGQPVAALAHLGRFSHPVTPLHAGLDALEAVTRAGDDAAKERWLAELDDIAAATGSGWAAARAAYARGDFEAALAVDTTRPFERARIQLAYGEHLRRARRRVDARVHLRAALETFEDLGAAPWAERATAELRASGETARKRDPSTLTQLTPQEMQVARFVAEGLPNKEVAAQLFVSPRTVDFHLRNVFTKLGITSRTELARLPLE